MILYRTTKYLGMLGNIFIGDIFKFYYVFYMSESQIIE